MSGGFSTSVEQIGSTVQKGDLGYFDFIKLYDAGVLPSAYGNNPATKYLVYFVPQAPGYKVGGLVSEIARTLGMRPNGSLPT